MSKAYLALALILLSGCATTANYEAKVSSWVGSDTNTLVMALGPPNSTFVMPNGNTMLTYNKSSGTRGVSSYNAFTNQTYTHAREVYCNTTFITSPANKVVSYSYEGRGCKSR